MNPAPSGTPETAGKPVLLVVEDEVLVRLDIAETLRQEGYEVLEAANADEAKLLLATFPDIALVFSDVHMPGTIGGAGLARFVGATYPAVGVLLTSGVMQAEALDPSVAFVGKPYMAEEIIRRIRRLLKSDP